MWYIEFLKCESKAIVLDWYAVWHVGGRSERNEGVDISESTCFVVAAAGALLGNSFFECIEEIKEELLFIFFD